MSLFDVLREYNALVRDIFANTAGNERRMWLLIAEQVFLLPYVKQADTLKFLRREVKR